MTTDRAPLRILLLITRLNIGGPAVQVVTLANALSSPLYKILLVSGILPDGEGDMSYIADGLGVRPTYIPELSREISPIRDIRTLIRLLHLIRQFRPDIIHTHTAKAGTVGRTAAILANVLRLSGRKIRIVHTFHGHTFYGYFGRKKTLLFKSIERILSRFTDRIIAISPSQKEDLCRKYAIAKEARVRVVPLGLDLSRFSNPKVERSGFALRWRSDDDGEVFVAAAIGRLTEIKNPRMVLSVAQILKSRGLENRFRFLLIGDGEQKQALQSQARSDRLEKMVFFTGWQREIETVYPCLDAVLLTSLNEGTPVSLIEAMASGKPIIATDVGGVRDLMGRQKSRSPRGFRIMENGIFVDSGDAEAMAEALVHMEKNREAFHYRAGENRCEVIRRFDVNRAAKEHLLLYRSL